MSGPQQQPEAGGRRRSARDSLQLFLNGGGSIHVFGRRRLSTGTLLRSGDVGPTLNWDSVTLSSAQLSLSGCNAEVKGGAVGGSASTCLPEDTAGHRLAEKTPPSSIQLNQEDFLLNFLSSEMVPQDVTERAAADERERAASFCLPLMQISQAETPTTEAVVREGKAPQLQKTAVSLLNK